MLGPFATASRRTPIHQVSLLSHARFDVHDNDDNDNNDNDNAWQRGLLWPHRMGPITQVYGEMQPSVRIAIPGTRIHCVRVNYVAKLQIMHMIQTVWCIAACRWRQQHRSNSWNIQKLENAWQSLAYSPLGAVVSLPVSYTHLTLPTILRV